MPSQRGREHVFAVGQGIGLIPGGEARALPGGGVALDDEGAHRRRMPVVVGVEGARLVLDEGLRQGLEALGGAEPAELVGEIPDRSAERLAVSAPHVRIDSVGGDDEIVAHEFFFFCEGSAVFRGNPDTGQLPLQQLQEFQPADRREADAVYAHRGAAVHDHQVGPRFHLRGDALVGLGVILAQEFERAVREHHAEAEGRIGRVLLDDADLPVGMLALGEVGEIQPRRAGACDENSHLLYFRRGRRSSSLSNRCQT